MRHLPWLAAGVTKEVWERARNALVDHLADLAWTARDVSKHRVNNLSDEPMQRLAEMSRGDRDATLYGLTLAERRKRDD
jgi:hypothetical protein